MCIFAGGMHVSAKERECFEVDLETDKCLRHLNSKVLTKPHLY